MKAAIVTARGESPAYADLPAAQPAGDAERVTVTAAALSHVARSRASGTHYSSGGAFPFVPGIDGVGRLDSGRRVYFFMPEAPNGSMAEQTLVAAAHCAPLPDDLDDVTAAAIAIPGVSSWAAFTGRARLQPGETVLVNGATGAAGRLAVQIARHLGAGRIIATGRNPEALRELTALGADATIVLGAEGDALERSFTPHFAAGVDIVVDYLWGPSAERLLIAAARAGDDRPLRYVEIGSISGPDITLPGAVLRASAITLMGSGLGSIPADLFLPALSALLQGATAAGLKIATRPVPLAQIGQAWSQPDSGARTVFTMNRG